MQFTVTLLAIALPALNPFSPGPSPAVVPLLFSWACALALIGVRMHASGECGEAGLARAVSAGLLVAAMVSAAIGLLQYFGATAIFGQWVNGTGVGEAFANLRQRNQFATVTTMGLAALLLWPARPNSFGVSRTWANVGMAASAVLLAFGNAASSSRTGLLEWVMVIAIASLWRLRRGIRNLPTPGFVLVLAALAYVAAAFSLPVLAGLDPSASGLLARLHDSSQGCASRLVLWGNVLHLIARKPWLGWGWGELDYAHFTTLYPGARFCDILDNAHNLPLHLAVELGVPVALLACGVVLWLVYRARPWREFNTDRQMAWTVLAVILLHSMLEYPLWYGPFQIAAGLSIWVLWSTGKAGQSMLKPSLDKHDLAASVFQSSVVTQIVICSATVLLLCIGNAAWDYRRVSQIYLPVSMRLPAYRENTLEKIRGSWLFRNQVRFAEFTTTDLTPDNAVQLNAMAHELLHFSPEARVAEKLIESAVMLGRDDEALAYAARYRAAFPAEYARWDKTNRMPLRFTPPVD